MREKRWVRWIVILAAIVLVGQGLGWLLLAQGARRAGQGILVFDALAAYAWVCHGVWTWRDIPFVRRAGALFAITGVVAALSTLLWTAFQWYGIAIGISGVWLMLASFLVGLAFIRALLMPGLPVLGVARTLIDEAIRMKVAGVFIVGLALLVPVLPLILDPAERLHYRMQFLLNWSLAGTGLLLSLLTIFLSCGTVCSEIKNCQIYLTMTKPVGRLQYLLGKLLGIVLLNLLLLTVAGLGIYLTIVLVARGPDRGQADRMALLNEVLLAREVVNPEPPDPKAYKEAFDNQLQNLRKNQPSPPTGPPTEAENEVINVSLKTRWYSIAPGNVNSYVYKNLQNVKTLAPLIQLRLKAVIAPEPPDKRIPIFLWLNEVPWPVDGGYHVPITVASGQYQIVNLPSAAINEKGDLVIRMHNNGLPSSIAIETGKQGLELLYPVGRFDVNFIRGLAIIWFRLIFLSMVGITAATFLGFPIACLASLATFLIANFSQFIGSAIASMTLGAAVAGGTSANVNFTNFMVRIEKGEVFSAIKLLIGGFDWILVQLLGAYATYDPVPYLSDGRAISNGMVLQAGLTIGLLWTAGLVLLASIIFHRRELARVIV